MDTLPILLIPGLLVGALVGYLWGRHVARQEVVTRIYASALDPERKRAMVDLALHWQGPLKGS